MAGACSRSTESPRPTTAVDDAATRAGTEPRVDPEAQPEPEPEPEHDVEPEPDGETETPNGAELAEPPPRPSRTGPPTDAPTGSVNPSQPAPEAEAEAPKSPSPNVDLSFQGKPLFIENDPLETSGVPICVVFIRGLAECWPRIDPETRELIEDLLTEMINGARSLKRAFVREKACEMGWDFATRILAPRCPGVFPAEKPPTANDD
jgi:hypothetical protein